MKKTVLFFAFLLAGIYAQAADIPVVPTGPVYALAQQPQFGTLAWGTTGPGGFNNNFYFVPTATNESVCVFVYNNNPTNLHQFNVSIVLTGNPANTTPSDGTWQTVSNGIGVIAPVSPGVAAGIGGLVSGAARVSVNLSASGVAGGSPDTASIVISQTPGNCFSGGSMLSGSQTASTAFLPVQIFSDTLSQSFFSVNSQINPATGTVIANVFSPVSAGRQIYFDKVVVTTTSASPIQFFLSVTTTSGTTCSTGSPQNQKLATGVPSSVATVFFTCGGTPTVATTMTFSVTGGVQFVLDLKGFIIPNSGAFGLMVQSSGTVTGNLNASFYWYEK